MKTLIVNNAGVNIKDFVYPLSYKLESMNARYDVRHFSELPEIDKGNYDRVLLSASPMGDDIVEHHLPFYQWVRSYGKPIFGICAGHQVIGRLYGAELIRADEMEDGLGYIIVDRDDPIFNGYGKEIPVMQHHRDSITVPEDFLKLAHSSICENEVMRHKSLPIVTVQFHAEEMNMMMVENFYNFYKS